MASKQKATRRAVQYTKDAASRELAFTERAGLAVPLTPPEYVFCEWLARQPSHLRIEVQRKMLEDIYNGGPPDPDNPTPRITVPRERLQKLKRRKEFIKYFEEMRLEEVERARAMFIKRLPGAVSTHFDALEQAMANKDYRSVPAFTTPVLDRVLPKRETAAPVAAVKIELTGAQRSNLDLDEPSIEVEVIDDGSDQDEA